MSFILTSRTRDRQPQGVVGINRGNPLTKRITTLVPFGPAGMFDLVSGAKVALSSGTVDADQRGISLRGSGSAACASIPLNLSAYTKIVLSFWMYWNAFANDDDLAMEFTANGASTNGGFGLDPNQSSTSRFQIFGNTGGVGFTGAKSFTRPSAAAWHHYMVGLDTSVPGFISDVYVDGVSQSLTTDVTGNGTVSFSSSTLYLFSRNNTSLFGAGRIQNLVIRGGADLLASEANAECRNSWSLFAPERTPVFYSLPSSSPTVGTIWTSKTRTRQPQGAVQVNWANPLSRALAVAVSGAAPGRNLASQSPVIETNNPTIAGTSKGLGISWPSTTSPGVHVGAGSLLKGSAGNYTTGLTLAVYANPSASGTRFLPLAMSDNATQPQSYLIFNGAAAAAAAGMFSYQTQGNTGAQAAGVIDGKWHLFAAVLPEGSTTPILYVDGVDVTASPLAAPSGYGADAQDVYVGGYSSGSWAVSGFFLALALGLNRGLLAAEVKALSDNPWQLFAPERTPVFYSISGVSPGPSTANRIMLLRRPGLSRVWR